MLLNGKSKCFMKLENRVLGLPTFKEENGITYKL